MRPSSVLAAVFAVVAACGRSSGITGGADGGPFDATAGPEASIDGSSDASSGGGDGGSYADARVDAGSGGDSAGSVDSGGETESGGGDGSADAATTPDAGASALMYHNHINRDGFFIDPLLTTANASAFALDTTFHATYPDNVWATALYVENGVGGNGTYYVATASNNIYAFDENTGAVDWTNNYGTAAASSFSGGCGNVKPIGITGTPAIDLATRLVVFDAVSADGNGFIKTHTVYGVSIDDGSVKWSVDASTIVDSTGLGFSPQPQNQRGAVLIVNGVAYIPYGGHGDDCGVYHGWVIGVPLNGVGARGWATQVQGAGIWAVGGAASDGQSVYVATGNARVTETSASPWGDSEGIIRLGAGPTFSGLTPDYFAPADWVLMDNGDWDISGSGPLIIDEPSMTPSKLVLAEGKDQYVYLIDRTNLGGITTTAYTANVGALLVTGGEIANGAAFAHANGTTYIVLRPNGSESGSGCPGPRGDLVAVKLDMSAPQKMSVAWCAEAMGAGSPIITTSDGTNDALVWLSGGDNTRDPTDTDQLRAWDLTTGNVVFDGGGTANMIPIDAGQLVHHFSSLLAVHGKIVLAADGGLYVFRKP